MHFSPLDNSWFTWTTDFRRKTNISLKGGLESGRQVSPNFLGPSLTISGDDFQIAFTPRVGIWECRNPFRQENGGQVRDLTKRVSLASQDFEESFSLSCLWVYPLMKDKDNNNIYFRMSSWASGGVSAVKLLCACSVVQSCFVTPWTPACELLCLWDFPGRILETVAIPLVLNKEHLCLLLLRLFLCQLRFFNCKQQMQPWLT